MDVVCEDVLCSCEDVVCEDVVCEDVEVSNNIPLLGLRDDWHLPPLLHQVKF